MGNANIKLFYQNDPAHALYDVDRQASCNQVHMFMPEINCPIKKGGKFQTNASIFSLIFFSVKNGIFFLALLVMRLIVFITLLLKKSFI